MWLYELPVFVGMPIFVCAVVGASLAVVLMLRRWVRRMARHDTEWDRVLGYVVGAYGVFYGVTLGLIAAGAYGNYVEVEQAVLRESSSVAVIYRAATQMPEPHSSQLQDLVVEYTEDVISEDWPLQRQLIAPESTDAAVTAIQDEIMSFTPETPEITTLQAQTMAAFNLFVAERRERIALTHLALPGVMWTVLIAGAILNAVLIALIKVTSVRVHLLMSGMIAAFVALMIYAISGFDHAYAGPIAVTPDYFVDLTEGLFREVR